MAKHNDERTLQRIERAKLQQQKWRKEYETKKNQRYQAVDFRVQGVSKSWGDEEDITMIDALEKLQSATETDDNAMANDCNEDDDKDTDVADGNDSGIFLKDMQNVSQRHC